MSKKEAYVQKLHAKIDEWNADIDKLSAKADQVEADSRLEFEKQIEALKAKREEFKLKLGELSQTSEDAWDDLKSGMDLAWDALNEALRSATARFK